MFGSEKEIFRREKKSYGVLPYFLSKQTVGLLDMLAIPYFFCLPYYWMRSAEVHFLDFYVSYVLLHFLAAGFAQYVSVVSPPSLTLLV